MDREKLNNHIVCTVAQSLDCQLLLPSQIISCFDFSKLLDFTMHQIISCFGFSRFLYFTMHWMYSKNYECRKDKIINNLGRTGSYSLKVIFLKKSWTSRFQLNWVNFIAE
jgi:hypothetical protein